jgi:putative NADH-flavin reductase
MDIVIVGATGPLGRRITQAALADGYQVTAFVRTTGRLDPHPGLREVTGDVLDPGSVAAAMPGHDAVISALGHSNPSSAGRSLYPGASHIISVMQMAGVSRLLADGTGPLYHEACRDDLAAILERTTGH